MSDKISTLGVSKYLIAISLMITSFGCASQIPPVREWADKIVGRPVDALIESAKRPGSYIERTGGQIREYQLENGTTIVSYPIREGCSVLWEVNSSRVIVGYRTEGSRCF